MDIISVISLGQLVKQPLIGPSSELVDGSEPHDHIYPRVLTARVDDDGGVDGRGVPGVGRLGGYQEGYTGY